MINPDLDEPLSPATARQIVRRIVASGAVAFSNHAIEEMEKDRVATEDCLITLRAGWVMPAEFERGTWRYRVVTDQLTVVIAFRSPEALVIVTTWRNAG